MATPVSSKDKKDSDLPKEGTGVAGSAYYHFDSSGRKLKSKWDDFDVDAELEKVDDNDGGASRAAGAAATPPTKAAGSSSPPSSSSPAFPLGESDGIGFSDDDSDGEDSEDN